MSEFIFVIPSGWQQVSAYAIGEIGSRIGDFLTANDLTGLSDALKEYNEIGTDAILVEARFFNGEVLAIRLG